MKTKGFTLVELLVVIAILAILATVSVVGYTSYINSANASVAQQELAQIKTAVMADDILNNGYDITDGKVDEADVTALNTFLSGLTAELSATAPVVAKDATTITYTVKGNTATWDLATGKITLPTE